MKKILALTVILAGVTLLFGCTRVKALGKSVEKNQEDVAGSILYTDSLFTDDGYSRLTGPLDR